MFTFWWITLAFIGGGTAGIVLMSLVRMAGEEPRPLSLVREAPAAPVQREAERVAAGRC